MKARNPAVRDCKPILILAFSALAVALQVPSRAASESERESARALRVDRATDVVTNWDPAQHLYVKGDPGVGETQLSDLEAWLDENAPNWTVVLVESAQDERYTDPAGQSYNGMDAVEHSLGKGLPNQTSFGQLVDARTKQANGAFFILFLKERKFSYFGSAAQDSRGLGEDRWQGNLDKPAIAAMRSGGRIVDAVKDTITNIESRLSSAIAAEENRRARQAAERERKAAAEKAALEAARDRAKAALGRAADALDRLEKDVADLLEANPGLTGDLARPDLEQWRVRLKSAESEAESGDPDAASLTASQAESWAEARLKDLAEFRMAPRQVEELTKRYQGLADHRFAGHARQELTGVREALNDARNALERGDLAFIAKLATAKEGLLAAENRIAAQEVAAVKAQRNRIAAGSALLLLLVGLGWYLNRRRRDSMIECLDLLKAWENALGEKGSALVTLLDRSYLLLGLSAEEMAGRYKGETRRLGEQAIKDVDEMFIMASCAKRVLAEAKAKAAPSGIPARFLNLFATSRYGTAIRLLRDQPIVFNPEDGLERIMRGVKTERDRLQGDLASYQPFTMSFNKLMESFNERAERALSDLDTIETSLASAEKTLRKIQADIDSLHSREGEISPLEKEDGLLGTSGVFSELIPSAQEEQTEAEQVALYDAVGALQHQGAAARQKVDDASILIDTVLKFRKTALPKVLEDSKSLSKADLDTQWISDEFEAAADEIERLVKRAMEGSAAAEIEAFENDLEQFRNRVATSVDLDRECREAAQKSIDDTTATIEKARRELGAAVGLAPETLLCEPELDPSERVRSSIDQVAVFRSALGRGDVEAARNALDAVERLTREAHEIVKATQSAFAEHKAVAAARQQETQDIEDLLPEHEQILSDIEAEYAASVLALGAGDPEHPNANGTIEDNLRETRDHLNTARDLSRQADETFHKAGILRAAEMLSQIGALQETARFRLEEVKEKRDRLVSTDQENQKRLNRLTTRREHVKAEIVDYKSTIPTIENFEEAEERITEARGLIGIAKRDPFKAEEVLTTAADGLDAVMAKVQSDRELYAQAEASLRSAEGQLRAAQNLCTKAESDRIADSAEITRALGMTERLSAELDDVRQEFDQPHGDWPAFDSEADRISAEAGRLAATLRRELDEAESALSAISRAAATVRNAGGWTGAFGIRIFGSPGSDRLSQARQFLQSGDYARTQIAAEAARREAERSIAEAQARVLRRRREEEQRREAARRRRREEERRRRSAMSTFSHGHSSFGGSRSSFSSGSGTSRSSFSSGSGVSRSGW